jgi:hypothetical protein
MRFTSLPVMTALMLASMTETGLAQDVAMAGIWLPDGARSQRTPSPLPFTADGEKAVSEWLAGRDPLEDDPGRFCQSPGMPSLVLSGAGYPLEIVITEDAVYMLMEIHQQVRRVFLDEGHPDRTLPQRNGHSVGHWEGNTLVVDTTAIRPIYFGAVPHTGQAHVVERLRVIDNGDALVNEVTITDPGLYTQPITITRFFSAAPEGTLMLEYECSESLWIEHEESRGFEPFSP